MVAWQIYDGKTVSLSADKWTEGGNKTMCGETTPSPSHFFGWKLPFYAKSQSVALLRSKVHAQCLHICSQRWHWDVMSKFTHTHNGNHLFALLFPTNWDLRRLETETCWRLLASSSCATSCCQLPDLRPARPAEISCNTTFCCSRKKWMCSHISYV